MIISISGAEGAGKSTIAKMLAAKLGWPRYYIGGIRREKAKERGLTLEEYNKLGETDPSTDLEVDEYQKKLGETQNNFIIEGRTSWYFIPQSFKIFLDVTFAEGAKRVFGALQKSNERNEGKNLQSEADVLKSLLARRESDKLRYGKYFGISVFDLKNYDFVLDTTNLNINQVFARVFAAVERQINSNKTI
ncbi:MAG TPA: cytidylate kinase family protein [Candidatus Nanoarchaeia archaeon]|nr:cytidylate kinase family protein [Candidatus Nanoarchaeia archaeon]